jgi:hypothetical protein
MLNSMTQRTSSRPSEEHPRAQLVQRLWRNQLGILLAIALTVGALIVLVLSFRV